MIWLDCTYVFFVVLSHSSKRREIKKSKLEFDVKNSMGDHFYEKFQISVTKPDGK